MAGRNPVIQAPGGAGGLRPVKIHKEVRRLDRLVTIKSCKYGMEIHMDPEVPFETLLEHMQDRFQNSARFFQGAQMAVSFHGRSLNYTQEQTILSLISDTAGIDIVCVIDEDMEHEQAYRRIVENAVSDLPEREGQFYKGTLGKRQVIESDASIVILGNVEPGASVIAKGSIVVVGALRGNAHAGAAGNREAYIVALSMRPRLLLIGDMEARRQDVYQEGLAIRGPKLAAVDGSRIRVVPLVN